eukprot:5698186-Prymnesium_polylepis.1
MHVSAFRENSFISCVRARVARECQIKANKGLCDTLHTTPQLSRAHGATPKLPTSPHAADERFVRSGHIDTRRGRVRSIA